MSSVSQFPPKHLISDEESENIQELPDGSKQQPLSLPAPTSTKDKSESQIDVSGGNNNDNDSIVKFDKLGPMVVNSDGTISRIHNWQSMTEGERERTVRLVNQRNQSRLKALREKEALQSNGTETDK